MTRRVGGGRRASDQCGSSAVRALCGLLATGVALIAAADSSGATIRRSDESVVKAALRAIDGNALVVVDPVKGDYRIPLDDIAEVVFDDKVHPPSQSDPAHKVAPKRDDATPKPMTQWPWRATMTNGDLVSVKPERWGQGKLGGLLHAPGDVPIELPLAQVKELWCGAPDKVKAARALNEKPGTDDIAFALRENQVLAVRGVALGLNASADALRFKFGSGEREIGLSRLVGLVLAQDTSANANAAASPDAMALKQVVSLNSGDLLTGTWTHLDDHTVGLDSSWGQPLTLPRGEIAKINTRNGRVTSLSDLTPVKVEETPYFDRVMPWQIDRSLEGKPLDLGEGTVARGLAVHSRCVLTYELGGAFAEFRSKVGFQQPEGKRGEAVVRVIGDDRVLFERKDAKGDQPPFEVSVPLSGVRRLSLEVDFGEGQDVADRVVWGNARIVRKPATEAKPPASN